MGKVVVLIEKGEHNYGASVPLLPGCVSTGDTLDEVKKNIQEAIDLHLGGMEEDGIEWPIEFQGTEKTEYDFQEI